MSRYSSAYMGFIERLREVENICKLARVASRRPGPLSDDNLREVNTLCRAGVVLLCGHVEGYIEDLGEIALEKIFIQNVKKDRFGDVFLYHLSRPLISEIKDTNDPDKLATKVRKLFVEVDHLWSSDSLFTKQLPAEYFIGDFSNPKVEKIRKFFGRFGYDDFLKDLGRVLKSEFPACKNMVDQVVDQRNKIAHGDRTTTGTPDDLTAMIDLTKKFCRETDNVVAVWFRSHKCTLRC